MNVEREYLVNEPDPEIFAALGRIGLARARLESELKKLDERWLALARPIRPLERGEHE